MFKTIGNCVANSKGEFAKLSDCEQNCEENNEDDNNNEYNIEGCECDPYKELGINKDKNPKEEDMRREINKLRLIYHPDKGGDEARFKCINSAWEWIQNNYPNQPPKIPREKKRCKD